MLGILTGMKLKGRNVQNGYHAKTGECGIMGRMAVSGGQVAGRRTESPRKRVNGDSEKISEKQKRS